MRPSLGTSKFVCCRQRLAYMSPVITRSLAAAAQRQAASLRLHGSVVPDAERTAGSIRNPSSILRLKRREGPLPPTSGAPDAGRLEKLRSIENAVRRRGHEPQNTRHMLDALPAGVLLISAAIWYLQALPAIPTHPALGAVSLVCDTTPGHDRESPADIVRVCRTAAGSITANG